MSFSQEVKEEIEKHISTSRHCQIAEMAAYVANFGYRAPEGGSFFWRSEKEAVLRKVFTLLGKTYNIYSVVEDMTTGDIKSKVISANNIRPEKTAADINAGEGKRKDTGRSEHNYRIVLTKEDEIRKVLQSVRFSEMKEKTVSALLLKNDCCRRAFLRGSFLCIGSMSNPAKSYHMEYVCGSRTQAQQIADIIGTFRIDAKITKRKHHFVVYIKEGEAIVDLLNIMGAHISLMNLENLRIVKEVRSSVNRRVNCETANISKTINAASRQMEDILYLRDHYGLDRLPEHLKEMAQVRLEHEDAPLKELGEYLDPPVGKSGVNHRLRRLTELAEELRDKRK